MKNWENKRSEKLRWFLFHFIFWGGVVGLIVLYSVQIPLGFDEAYNLNLAVTIAQYNRYASHFAAGFRYFDPAISTGPSLMLLLGLWFKAVTPSLLTVRFFMGGTFLLSLVFIYAGTYAWLNSQVARIVTAIFLLLPYVLFWGGSAQGDIWAVGWVFISFSFLKQGFDSEKAFGRWVWLFCSGVSLGVALLTKTIIVLLFPALVCSALVSGWLRRSWRSAWFELFPSLIAVAMFAAWELFPKLVLRWFAAPEIYASWLQTSSSRDALMWQVVIFDPFSHTQQAWASSIQRFGPFLIAFVFVVVLASWKRHAETPLWDLSVPFERIALFGAITWFVWFYFVSGEQANNRHLLLGYVLIVVLVVNALVTLWKTDFHLPTAPRVVAIGALILLLGWGLIKGVKVDYDIYRHGRANIANQNKVATWVHDQIPLSKPIGGVGWFVPWDIVFLTGHLPSQMEISSKPSKGGEYWLILTPELRATGNLTDDIQLFVAKYGVLAFQEDDYQIYRIER